MRDRGSVKEKDPKWVAVGKRSKAKGDEFEREIAKALTKKFEQDLEEGGEFRRAPMSGGWSKRLKHTFGDLITPEWFCFLISCKNIGKLDITSVFATKEPLKVLEKWWDDAVKMAQGASKEPLLIIKIKQKGVVAVLEKNSAMMNGYINGNIIDCGPRFVIVQWDKLLDVRNFFWRE